MKSLRRNIGSPFAAFCFAAAVVVNAAPAGAAGRYAPDRLIVKFRQPVSRNGDASVIPRDPVRALGLRNRADVATPAFARRSSRRKDDPPDGAAPNGPLLLKLRAGFSVEEALGILKENPLLEYAEPDHIGTAAGTVPADPDYAAQWHHDRVDSPDAWDLATGSSNIIVAVLDTGVNAALAEFSGRTVPGYDFVNDDADPDDDSGHGTAVAGVVCANANNGVLGAGVDWRCRLMPVKVLDQDETGFYSIWAQGIDWAVAQGAKIINLSAGGEASDITLATAVSNAVRQGVVFVAATHNDGANAVRFPARMAETIAVGATTTGDVLWADSNYGPEVDLVAPGEQIATVYHNGQLVYGSGTSVAVPLVAGVAALMCSLRPGLDNETVRAILRFAAEDRVGDTRDVPGWDPYYGWGRLNAYHALQLAALRCSGLSEDPGGGIDVTWACPSNASSKRPFGVAFADSLTGAWSRVESPTNMVYSDSQARWKDDGSETGSAPAGRRYYRPFVK